jgi:cation diffusion facilitator family transporter
MKISIEKKATIVSSSVAFFLTILKLTIGVFSGSVAVLASAIDSVLDLFVSIFNYFAISNSEKPADHKFNYGRGKIEALASVIEGTIITLSGLFLFYVAINKYITNEISQYAQTSIVVMFISLSVTTLLVIYLNNVAKQTNNMVIKADALHYKVDIWANLAVVVSLLLVYFTENEIFDVLIGGAIAIYIIYSAYELIQDGVLVLLDSSLDEDLTNEIENIIKNEKDVNDFHWLKTRTAAHNNFVDVHLVFDCVITLMSAHRVADNIEYNIKQLDTTKKWIINIHLDPYDDSNSDDDLSDLKS